MILPNWLRIILSILTILSFYPQLFRIWSRRDSTGISVYYVLFNLIAATEQFTIMFFLMVNDRTINPILVHNPRSTGDWLNLCQMSLFWMLLLIFFFMTLYYLPNNSRFHISSTLTIYAIFLLISVIPEFFDVLSGNLNDPPGYRDGVIFFFAYNHFFYINPYVVILMILSIFFQGYKILQAKSAALSIVGSEIQSIVFALLGVSWLLRFTPFPYDAPDYELPWPFLKWYYFPGCAAVHHFVFAAGQAVLFCLSVRCNRRCRVDEIPSQEEETEPLLRND